MRIEIICIGSELLKNRVNTNSLLIAQKLQPLGLHVQQTLLLPDDKKAICAAFKNSLNQADIVFVSGGLGPTFDDITRTCLASVCQKKLKFVPAIFKDIQRKFSAINKQMPIENKRQAYIIEGADVLDNTLGTAPGQHLLHKKDGHQTEFFLLPGPPRELEAMMQTLTHNLQKKYGRKNCAQKSWHMFGAVESEINAQLQPTLTALKKQYGNAIDFTILAGHSIVHFYCFVYGRLDSATILKKLDKKMVTLFAPIIFGRDEETLPQVVGKILTQRRLSLATAESCTGGLVAKEITDVPGSSAYFLQGWVTYSNTSKQKQLGVLAKTLKCYGAVSPQVVTEMAQGARRRAGSDFALALSGAAGPGGGSLDKPVGTVCFALAGKNFCDQQTRLIRGNRQEVRAKAALIALDMLRRHLVNS